MAKIKVKFNYPIYEGGINYDVGESVLMSEERLKCFPEDEYEIVGKMKTKREKKVKDIPAKDKEKSDVVLDF